MDLSIPESIETLTLDPHSIADVYVPPGASIVTQFGAYRSDKSIILGYNAEAASADACSSFPVQTDYKEIEEYRAVSFRRSYDPDNSYNSTVLVIGTEDGTKVDITTRQDAVGRLSSINGHNYTYRFGKSKELSITINKYESLIISSVQDLTGTAIKAHRPVVVYSGHECANVPSYSSTCDHLVEQIPPVNVWGTCYIAAAFAGIASGGYVRVVSANSDTYINVQCTVHGKESYSGQLGPYADGEFFQFLLLADWYCTFESKKPIMVVQFSGTSLSEAYGDPFMVALTDVQQVINEVPFYSIDIGGVRYNHYITVVVPKEYFNTTAILLDDEPLSAHDYATEEVQFEKCGTFVAIRLAVEPGYHFLHHTSPEARLGLTVYGFASDTSYGYCPGLNQGEITEYYLPYFRKVSL